MEREKLIQNYYDKIKPYQNEINVINITLGTGYYAYNEIALYYLRNRKAKLRRKIKAEENLTLKLINSL